jgi:hypothetical protein
MLQEDAATRGTQFDYFAAGLQPGVAIEAVLGDWFRTYVEFDFCHRLTLMGNCI